MTQPSLDRKPVLLPAIYAWFLTVIRHLIALSLVLLIVVPRPLSAAEWYAEPWADLTTTYNDNIFLRRTAIIDTFGAILNLDAKLGRRTERSNVSLDTRLEFNQYTNSDALDQNNQFFKLASHYSTERNTWRLDGYYHLDSTATSELEDTGLVQNNFRVDRWSALPSWEHAFTEKTSGRISYRYLDVDYEQGAFLNGLFDFDTQNLDATIAHQWSPATDVFLTAYGLMQDVPQISGENNSYGGTAGFGYNFSETLRVTLAAGAYVADQKNTISGVTIDSTNTGGLFNASLEKQFDLTIFALTASQFVIPTGRGDLEQRRQLNFSLEHRLMPTVTLSLPALIFVSNPTGGFTDFDIFSSDRTYYRVQPGIRWQISRGWFLDGSYRYIRNEQLGTEAAVSNAFFATLAYHWPPLSASR